MMRGAAMLVGAERLRSAVTSRLSGDSARPVRAILTVGTAALCALLFPAMHRPVLRLVWNVTASVPVGLYRVLPDETPRSGELVALRPSPGLARYMSSRRYVEAGALLVKPVAAVAGQQVCRIGVLVTIDGEKVATARAVDHARRPLPVWAGCRRLQAGTMFLLAPSVPASFDGRYFGPVATSAVVGRAVPLWTWN